MANAKALLAWPGRARRPSAGFGLVMLRMEVPRAASLESERRIVVARVEGKASGCCGVGDVFGAVCLAGRN